MAKKKTSKKSPTAAKTSTTRTTGAQGSTAKKAAKKSTTSKKKVSRKKPVSKKATSKKAPQRKKAAKKAATRTTASKSTAKKATQKKTTTKKAAQRKKPTTTRKRASKKTPVTNTPAVDSVTEVPVEETKAPVLEVQEITAVTPEPEQAPIEVTEAPATFTFDDPTEDVSHNEAPTEAPAEAVAEVEAVTIDEPTTAPEEPVTLSTVANGTDWLDKPEPEVTGLAAFDEIDFGPEPEISGLAALDEPQVVEDVPAFEEAPAPVTETPGPRRVNGGADQVLLAAAERGEVDLVRTLLEVGTATTARDRRRSTPGWTPLMLATGSGHTDVVELLLSVDADVHATDDPDAEHKMQVNAMAETMGTEEISAEGLPLGRTALHAAAARGHVAIARMLIEAGAAPDAADYAGGRPLMLASESGDLDLARLFIKHGVDHDARDARGCGSLERAAMMGHSAVVAALLEGEITIDSRDAEKRTPLMYAVGAAHYDAARILLEGGADPSAEATSGFGVLCAAVCARGYFPDTTGELIIRPFPEDRVLPVVELLLRWGADDSLDSTGLRPSHRAEGLGYFAIVRILFDYSGEEEYRSAG